MNTKKRLRRLCVAKYIVTPERKVENGAVLCENDRILAVGGLSGFSLEEGVDIRRYPDAYITPGFIDTHIHGAGGFDCSSPDESVRPIEAMSAHLGVCGVTGFMATVVSSAPKTMIANLAKLAEARFSLIFPE